MSDQSQDSVIQSTSYEHVYEHFYRVPRMGALELTCGGGPFGFDIGVAIRVDYLLSKYKCDAIIETGCHYGDTTDYLSRIYSKTSILTCDVSEKYVNFVRHRLRDRPNVHVELQDSPAFVLDKSKQFCFPFYYLDAHWYDYWPLRDEISSIKAGVVCVDDFDIGHPRFSFDVYDGIKCDLSIIPAHIRDNCYRMNPFADVGFPCLQVGRRGGKCFYVVGAEVSHLADSCYFEKIQ